MSFIDQHRDRWPVAVLCRVLAVSTAAFYQFVRRPLSATQLKQAQITEAIETIRLEKYHDAYGSARMHRAVVQRGIDCCRNTVAKCMRMAGISANRRTKFHISTTDSNHGHPIAPNRLNQDFSTISINQVWLTDITYIPTLDQAITLRDPSPGLIVHSDRGSQYASDAFRQRLSKSELTQSMSRRGNCYDNAPMESFFKSYKTEEVQDGIYETHKEATRGVSQYIDCFYNPIHFHSSPDYCSPIDFEQAITIRTVVGES